MSEASLGRDRPLLEVDVAEDPLEQFRRWFREAEEAGAPLPHAMTLATATPEGKPSIRSVLLKEVDELGFVFYTSYMSRKAAELEANPLAAAAFRWTQLHREVRIEGTVERVDSERSDAYFATRPHDSQLAAWASPQSTMVPSRRELEARLAEAAARFEGQTVPRPEDWGGYRIIPERFEFWQGRTGRLHDRLCYRREAAGIWRLERLAP